MSLVLLKKKGIAPEIPEDLYYLMKKAVAMRKHIEKNKRDKDSKYRLILVESKIHRLVRYYKVTDMSFMFNGCSSLKKENIIIKDKNSLNKMLEEF